MYTYFLLKKDGTSIYPGYVGITGNLTRRLNDHRQEFRRVKLSRRYRILTDLGFERDNFVLIPIYQGNKTQCRWLEVCLITYLKLKGVTIANTSLKY